MKSPVQSSYLNPSASSWLWDCGSLTFSLQLVVGRSLVPARLSSPWILLTKDMTLVGSITVG